MTEEADDRAPNWSIWKHLSWLKLYECVALSLNIDPSLRHHPQAWMTGGPGRPAMPLFLKGQQFQERWFVAQRWLGSTLPADKLARASARCSSGSSTCRVREMCALLRMGNARRVVSIDRRQRAIRAIPNYLAARTGS